MLSHMYRIIGVINNGGQEVDKYIIITAVVVEERSSPKDHQVLHLVDVGVGCWSSFWLFSAHRKQLLVISSSLFTRTANEMPLIVRGGTLELFFDYYLLTRSHKPRLYVFLFSIRFGGSFLSVNKQQFSNEFACY